MSDARALLTLSTIDGVGPARISTILALLRDRQTSVELLLEYSEADLVEEELLTCVQAEQFVSSENRDKVNDWLAGMDERDVQIIPVTSSRYPKHLLQSLGTNSPAVVYVYGSLDLLQTAGVAFAGARDVSPQGIVVTDTLSQMAVEHGFTVVSGGARGTDDAAHRAAVEAGGATILVLVEGILTARARNLMSSVDLASAVILSTFLPDDSWQRWRAMERNKFILGLSDRLIVIEAGDKGGTLAAGKEALKRELPTWVLDYREPVSSASGNKALLSLGAYPIPVQQNGALEIPTGLFAVESSLDSSSQQPKLF
jgi:DNA processing protein